MCECGVGSVFVMEYVAVVQVLAENGLLETRQQFEGHLSELRSKAELLSSHLEREAGQRKSTEEEVRV